jgi:hypothetical protein
MLSVANKPIILIIAIKPVVLRVKIKPIMLCVVMLNVAVPEVIALERELPLKKRVFCQNFLFFFLALSPVLSHALSYDIIDYSIISSFRNILANAFCFYAIFFGFPPTNIFQTFCSPFSQFYKTFLLVSVAPPPDK